MSENPVRTSLVRQVEHWQAAVDRLMDLDSQASPSAWATLETYLDKRVRSTLTTAVRERSQDLSRIRAELGRAAADEDFSRITERLAEFRVRYLRTETAVDFYADAVNTRTTTRLASYLMACDSIAEAAMRKVLDPLHRDIPPLLVYVDKGLGASILKAGLRLWEPTVLSPAAVVKIARHNLMRPTALLHEVGHQVAHILDWNTELSDALESTLSKYSRELSSIWAAWASEIAADAYAFSLAGYGSVVALADVLSGGPTFVYRIVPGDPHPVSYLRVLLGTSMCRLSYGNGPWDELGRAWRMQYPVSKAPGDVQGILRDSEPLLPEIASVILREPARAFAGLRLSDLVNPNDVSPESLGRLSAEAGASLERSSYWLNRESIRLVALSGLRMASEPRAMRREAQKIEEWMTRLGGSARAA